ncbi:copper amine oxidase N-terminal domain-containing protein [Paenibacillus sp. NPDC057934]|uniref:copper amine oxidase N-terminal domain-containing protein n=1 Tax=Paenibacillus sp. NPDC057934 TaxID=3346282 RepID=UPI0036DCF9A4
MNNILKTSAVLLTLSMALTTGSALAKPASANQNNSVQPSVTSAGQQVFTIEINGTSLTDTGYQLPGGKEPLVPLRAMTEALGFKLEWNSKTKSVELSQGNIFTTVKAGEDRYVINRMYTTLGTAPVLKGDKLYVPASFASEVLHQSVSVKGASILIQTNIQDQEAVIDTGVITSVYQSESGKYNSVQIQGAGTDGMILTVGPDTVFKSADGGTLAFTDLHIGMTVQAAHSMISTFSLPPQTPTYSITVLDKKNQGDLLGTAGTAEEVLKDADGSISFRLKGDPLTDLSQSEIVLRLAKDTVVVNGRGEAMDSSSLVKGAKVIGFYTPMMTKSLPPIGTAVKIVVQPAPARP